MAGAPPSDGGPSVGGQCRRCQKPAGSDTCRVPHPVHLREDCGGCSFQGRREHSFLCRACGQSYSLVSHMNAEGQNGKEEIEGARWCFSGRHTTAPLPPSDQRRVDLSAVALVVGPQLQAQLDELSSEVVTLTVSSAVCFDSSHSFTLNKVLPNLKELHLTDVNFKRVVLTPDTTPQLQKLMLQNVPDDCDLRIVCPRLREVSMHFWRSEDKPEVVSDMLRAATQLERFQSYKLWSNERLEFASPVLQSIIIHRSDSLESLSIWAPVLTELRLQGCFSLDSIEFLNTHPLAAELTAAAACRAPLVVSTVNSNLGAAAKRALQAHPRAVKSDSRFEGPMAATESYFASLHRSL